MASSTVKLKIPSICTFYNQKGCKKSKCTFLHICKGFIESTCDGCTLSHDIKSNQPRALLHARGFDTSVDSGLLTSLYRIDMVRTQAIQEPRKLNPPSICSYYNNSQCQKSDCTYVHICEKYVNGCCNALLCPLSHAITGGQAWEKLSACGFDANKTPEEFILDAYRSELIHMKWKQRGKPDDGSKCDLVFDQKVRRNNEVSVLDKTKIKNQVERASSYIGNNENFHQNKGPTQRETLPWFRQIGSQGNLAESMPDLSGNVVSSYPYLVCRNFNTKGCNTDKCKWLHICNEFVVGKCEKSSSCQKNHMLFYGRNKRVLHRAGFDTEKREIELFMDYIMKLKDEERINGDGKFEQTTRPESQRRSGKFETEKIEKKPPKKTKQQSEHKRKEEKQVETQQNSTKTECEKTKKKSTKLQSFGKAELEQSEGKPTTTQERPRQLELDRAKKQINKTEEKSGKVELEQTEEKPTETQQWSGKTKNEQREKHQPKLQNNTKMETSS